MSSCTKVLEPALQFWPWLNMMASWATPAASDTENKNTTVAKSEMADFEAFWYGFPLDLQTKWHGMRLQMCTGDTLNRWNAAGNGHCYSDQRVRISVCGSLERACMYANDVPWASYKIRKIAGCACAGNAGNVFPSPDFKWNRQLAIPACITARASSTCRDACRNR